MVITILTAGSRGDTQPYIALGGELQKIGYTVRIATFANYESFVKSFGLEFYPLKGDIASVAASDNARGAMKADNPLKFFLSFQKLKSLVFDLQKDLFTACEGAEAIIYHPGAAIGYFIAQHLDVPSILASPFPMTPTKEYPALIFYDKMRLGKRYNRITHKIFEKIMWFASKAPVKQFWKEEFGKKPEDFSCPYSKQITRSHPTLISCSQHVFPQPDDWPEHVYSPGYWFLEKKEYDPPADLLRFLQEGTPPIYIGFGSISDTDSAAQTTQLIIDALKLSGQRGILATGWTGMENVENVSEEIFILESVPHTWLFPQMAAVVHHGGAGTTAAGLRAGVPSIIIPYSNDQFAWGRRVFELGVGAKPIPRKKLTAKKLADAILVALSTDIQRAAEEIGKKITRENGAEEAALIIKQSLRN